MKFRRWISGGLAAVLVAAVGVPSGAPVLQTAAATAPVYNFQYGGGIRWQQGDALPTFAAKRTGDTIDAIDTGGMDIAEKYTAVTLQGLVNRDRARLLVTEGRNSGRARWFNDLIEENINWISLDAALRKYKSSVGGMILYDASNNHSLNVATSVAGAENSIVVPFAKEMIYQNTYGFTTRVNLLGKCGYTAASAYEWLYDNYYKNGKLNTRLLVTLNPTAHQTYIRDLAVATKSAVLWLDPTKSDQVAVLDKFFNAATAGVTCNLGWWPDEDPGVVYATRKGTPTVPADFFENATFFMSQSKQIDLANVPAKPTLQNKVYIALMFADGDNTQYNQGTMYDSNHWRHRQRGTVPITWTVSPALYYMAPQMLGYFERTAKGDLLVSGPSGFGYTKATRWREQAGFLNQYAAMTNAVFEKTGLNIITIWDRVPEASFKQFAAGMPSLLGATVNNNDWNDLDRSNPDTMFANGVYLHYPENGAVSYTGGAPIYGLGGKAAYLRSTNEARSDIVGKMTNFKGDKPMFLAKQFVPWDVGTGDVIALADELKSLYGDKIEFVRLDHLFMLMNEYNNQPYAVSLHANATASATLSGFGPAKAVNGSVTDGWKASGNGNWLQLDLGERCELWRYTLKNDETGYASAADNTRAYRFQYSLNGVDWVTADTVTGNSKPILYRSFANTIAARYVRVVIDDAGADATAAIQELEVYGTGLGVTNDNAPVAVTRVRVTAPKTVLNRSQTMQLNTVVSPANATNAAVRYTSSDASVARVEANGKVTALKKGTTTLRAMAADGSGKAASVALEVRSGKVERVQLNARKKTLKRGKTFQAKATVTPTTAFNRAVKWTTSSKKVATVSQTGLIKAKGYGVAVITATARDGSGKKAQLTVTVRPKQVTGLKAVKQSRRVKLRYKKAQGAAKYQIYMKTGTGGYKKLAVTKKRSFTTKRLKTGKKVRFKVRAIKTTGRKTAYGVFSKPTKAIKI